MNGWGAALSVAIADPAHLTSAFDYDLPPERIAQHPAEPRDSSRMLHLVPGAPLCDDVFTALPALLRPGDLLVANDTRVRAARLVGERRGGGRAELLVLEACPDGRFVCLVRPARRLVAGTVIGFGDTGLTAVIGGPAGDHPGARMVTLAAADGDPGGAIERAGRAPLPPYIREPLGDARHYQTVYAQGDPVSAAAPTAGLHFTPAVLEALRMRGVGWTTVQLDVGLGTFAPIRADSIDDHVIHEERCEVSPPAAAAVARARSRGGRVIAVGTTAMRTLESFAGAGGLVSAGRRRTRLFLKPGSEFRVADGLITNFHQPRSSLLVLLAGFIGMDEWRAAYEHALAGRYRFLSFGDCMLCWRGR